MYNLSLRYVVGTLISSMFNPCRLDVAFSAVRASPHQPKSSEAGRLDAVERLLETQYSRWHVLSSSPRAPSSLFYLLSLPCSSFLTTTLTASRVFLAYTIGVCTSASTTPLVGLTLRWLETFDHRYQLAPVTTALHTSTPSTILSLSYSLSLPRQHHYWPISASLTS